MKNKEKIWTDQEGVARARVLDIDVEKMTQQELHDATKKAEAAKAALNLAKASAIAKVEELRFERLQKRASEAEIGVKEIGKLQKVKSQHMLPIEKLPPEVKDHKEDTHPEIKEIAAPAAPVSARELERRRMVQHNLTELLHAETINFVPNSTKIVAESMSALEKIAKILSDNPGVVVNVEGHVWVPHSRRSDSEMMRQATKLSAYRAKSVVKSLRRRGVDKKQLNAEGFGGTRPLPEGQDSKRVEFKVVGLPENDDILDHATSQVP